MAIETTSLVQRYTTIYRQRMQGLPIVNPSLSVEAVDFRPFEEHQLGVLITPWFMNLVVLPGCEDWNDEAQGATVEFALPSETLEFMVCRDRELGVYLTAILFRTVADFPDQHTAREIAREVMSQLFEPGAAEAPDADSGSADKPGTVSRRELFTRLATR